MTTRREPIRVGIIGANPDRGWAFRAHVPALAVLPEFRVTAVATTKEESARRAAELTGARHWFVSAAELCECDDVDLVVVTVRVSAHRELVTAALNAGKHVYCEWPLGLDANEARTLLAMSDTTRRGFIGFQGRSQSIAARTRQLVQTGQLGAIQLVTVRASRCRGSSGSIDLAPSYTLDVGSGAGTLPVLGGHLLDLIDHVCGGIALTSVQTSTARKHLILNEDGSSIPVTGPDTATFSFSVGETGLGVAAVRDGDPFGDTTLTIDGMHGTAVLRTTAVDERTARQPQMAPMRLEFTDSQGVVQSWTCDDYAELPVPSRNVAAAYRNVANDLRTDTASAASFSDAVRVHEMLEFRC